MLDPDKVCVQEKKKKLACTVYVLFQAGEDLILPDQVDRLQSAAPGSGLYQPVDFQFPVGPIFNFVSGEPA